MHRKWRPRPALSAILAFLASTTAARQLNPRNSTNVTATSLSLQLQLGDDRTKFHVGEIIPVRLTFTSKESKKYRVMAFECGEKHYKYHVKPPLFLDRDTGTGGWSCGGPIIDINPEEKPFAVELNLNTRYRMDAPGKYQISVTSTRLGPAVTSNPVEIEIIPGDPAWESSELDRALTLIKSRTEKGLAGGCRILR